MVIDLHSHILPGVDDGGATLDKAVEMTQMAVDCGVFHMVATPHYNYYGHTTTEQIRAAFSYMRIIKCRFTTFDSAKRTLQSLGAPEGRYVYF